MTIQFECYFHDEHLTCKAPTGGIEYNYYISFFAFYAEILDGLAVSRAPDI